jgi:penicillin G amidase
MKIVKKKSKYTFVLILLFSIGLWFYTRTLQPEYQGEIALENLTQEVEIYFDTIGVPHINAQNEHDAYTALGYVHAQDRLWQMELIRRISAGRLSEIFGEKLIDTDKFMSGLGIEENAQKTLRNLDQNSQMYQLSMAYLDGINQYIEHGKTPLEFLLVGVEKEKYTLKDMYNVFGYMAFSFAVAHKTDPLLTEVKEILGASYLNELIGAETQNVTLIQTQKNPILKGGLGSAMQDLFEALPISPFIGSNSWVIGADKTKDGKVIFANDPHIGYSQPSVWYQSHIKTPTYEMYGFNLALVPFPLLGHNRTYAYGLTMFENDDVDFYTEENNPNDPMEYKTPNGYQKYHLVDKRIKVKDKEDLVYQIKVSEHGPIMNDLVAHIEDQRPIAMQWIYTKEENKILEVAYEISHSKSLEDFKKGASKLHAPGLNMMYGDAKNNIAWFASGKLYRYRDSLYTKTYLNGTSGKDEILGYLDFEQNPQAVNPSSNYVYSANNQPESGDGKLYPGYYLFENRAKRIVNLLEAKNDWTKEEVATMLNDVTSLSAPKVISDFLKEIDQKGMPASQKIALSSLKKWKGNFDLNEIGPVIYNRIVYEFQKNTFGDELGEAFDQFTNTPLIEKVLPVQMARENSVWWDDVTTTDKIETKKEIINTSFQSAFLFLQKQLGENVVNWTWDRVVSVEHKHAVGQVAAFRKLFNVGPFETSGGDQVINNQIYDIDSTGYYKVKAGPSTRRIVDFSDVENSVAILPTGQSGRVFSAHYKDQAVKYLNGEFVKMEINQESIEKSANRLVLRPTQ